MNKRDIQAAKNLESIWSAHKSKYKINQEQAAEAMGFSQSNFCQYKNGFIRISLDVLFVFTDYFKCNASDIFPDLKDKEED